MTDVFQAVSIVASGLFAGAAIYINVAEHPARMECGTAIAAAVFGPSYRRAAVMQVSLALLGGAAGVLAWAGGGGALWIAGSLLLLFVVPFTLLFIMGTNDRLLDTALERGSPEAHALLVRWGRLHAVRSVAGATSFLVFVIAVQRN